jgi:hypothetical protein
MYVDTIGNVVEAVTAIVAPGRTNYRDLAAFLAKILGKLRWTLGSYSRARVKMVRNNQDMWFGHLTDSAIAATVTTRDTA